MDIKKTLQYMVDHANSEDKEVYKQISYELGEHLNKLFNEAIRLQDKLENQCTECPLNRRHDDEECMFLRRQAD